MALYTKPYLPLPDQLALIKSRGLQVADDAATIQSLHRNGYYRLSAYWYPFREIVDKVRTDRFLPDSHFEDAVKLLRFDKALKLLLLDALENVEIAARVEVALTLGRYSPFVLETPRFFHTWSTSPHRTSGKIAYDEWKAKFDELVLRSKDEFVLHHERQYGSRSPIPIWIAIELWDFGLLSKAFSGMQNRDQVTVASRFNIPDWQIMQSWLRALNYVRNVIAHHGRLWNLNLSDYPRLPKRGQIPEFDPLLNLPTVTTRIYSVCCVLSYLTRALNPAASWRQDLKNLVGTFPTMPYASIQDMGFPADWHTHSFWK